MRIHKKLFLLLLLGIQVAKAQEALLTKDKVGAEVTMPQQIMPIKAPFPMPQLQLPKFGALVVSIVSTGARENTMATKAIQQAIDETNVAGGGMVLVPKGKWQTGRLLLKSNVNFHIAEGAELYFSGEVADYQPAVFTRNEGIELMSLGACIYANGQRNIAVTGKGKLIGPAKDGSIMKQVVIPAAIDEYVPQSQPVSKRVYSGADNGPIFLPMFISPINCSNVLIEGVSLENTAFWNIVPVY